MSTSRAEAPPRHSPVVDSDFLALASHMNDCQRSRGRFFAARSALEWLHAAASARIVTSAALVIIGGLALVALV